MAVRTTVDISEPLHHELRVQSELSGIPMRFLIVKAIEQAYSKPRKGRYVTGPMVPIQGKLGPAFPVDENPHEFVCS